MQIISIDKKLFSMEVLLKTAYSFTDRVYIHLSQDEHHWIINWESKTGLSITAQEFENELIQQQTRLILEKKTAEIRKIIIARALASTIVDTSDSSGFEYETYDSTDTVESEDILKGWHEVYDQV